MSRHNKRHTDPQHGTAEPTAPLDDIDMLLTHSEIAITCAVIAMVTGVWVALLGIVSGYAWERWVGDFLLRAISWLLLP